MSIKFRKVSDELHLVYTSDSSEWIDRFRNKLDSGGHILVKTFFLNASKLVNDDAVMQLDNLDDIEEFIFRIGKIENGYIRLDKEIFSTKHQFFVSGDINFERKFFVYRAWTSDRSILLSIDNMLEDDNIYIGGKHEDAIPLNDYKRLVEFFPRRAELEKYLQMRIAGILEGYCQLHEPYSDKFNKYIARKNAKINEMLSIKPEIQFIENIELNIQQFRRLKDDLSFLLERSSGIDEKTWQKNIQRIVRLVYSKYIASFTEVKVPGVNGEKDKRPDFMLVDNNGYIDFLEIKEPQIDILTASQYRNNYVPKRELSGSIQQIEKYIHCVSIWGATGEKKLNERYGESLPNNLRIRITNPKGMLILGRSNQLNQQQLKDLELIRRQFANISDIITYDDLIGRIDNILVSLQSELSDLVKKSESDMTHS